MRLIVEDRDGLTGEFYATMQERADSNTGGRLAIGPYTDGHVTILAIETPDGGYGWLKGTVPGEQAKALLHAAAVLDAVGAGTDVTLTTTVVDYLTETAGHLVGAHVALVQAHRERQS